MSRQDYIYQLVGKIADKRSKKKKDGTIFFQLAVVIKDKEQIKKINVFSDSCKSEVIWQNIEANNYIGREYLFYCKNYMGSYYLIDWKILKDHGSN